MTRTILPALLFSGLLLACADKKSAVDYDGKYTSFPSTTTTGTSTPKAEVPQFGGTAPADSLFFTLQRTPCFGQCKAYVINVYRSGYATYDGRSHVEKEGMHRGRVGMDTLRTLMSEAEKIGFFELQDRYDNENVTDLPSSIIRVVGNGKDKKVVGRMGTPEAFNAFVEKAQAMLFPMPWIPVLPEE